MKAPRLTLSIALLLSLPAKMNAADLFTAETPAGDSIISFRHQLLANATDSVLTHRSALTAIVGLQNPKMHNSERERDLLASGKYSWQPVKDGERTRYILQGDGVYIFDEEQPVSEAPVAVAESSSRWITSLLPTLPTLFTRASTSEEPVKSESAPTFKDILQKLDPEVIDKKNDVVLAIPRTAYVYKGGVATVPLNNDSQADWKLSRAMRLEEGIKAKSVLAPRRARVNAYYADAAVTKQMLEQGIVRQELALFNKTTEQRALARQGSTPADQQQLLNLVESRRIRMEGGRTQQPGLKLLSALDAKTAEQRTKVLVQLRATESALTNALNAARKQAYTALNQSPNYELIFNLAALTNAIQDTTATEGVWANNILQQFTQKTQGTSLTFLPLAAFADGLINVYNSWNTSFGEPAQATELRTVTQAIPAIEADLADAKEKKIGHLIDRHTLGSVNKI